MYTKALLEVSIEGLGALHRTPIFPCGIFQYMKGVNDKPGTPNYDLFKLAVKSTAKRLYPNYLNSSWSNQTAWAELDWAQKQEYIDSLPEEDYNKLIDKLKQDPALADKLGLEIE